MKQPSCQARAQAGKERSGSFCLRTATGRRENHARRAPRWRNLAQRFDRGVSIRSRRKFDAEDEDRSPRWHREHRFAAARDLTGRKRAFDADIDERSGGAER